MTPLCDHLWINASLATCDPAVKSPYGNLTDYALGIRGETISLLAPMSEISLEGFSGKIHDAGGAWITPGLIDCHTHIVYGGNRVREIELRLTGVSYAEIARQGGGIMSTVRATRSLDETALLENSFPRLAALAAEGVTTVEIKSGYGLTTTDELKMLRVIRRLAERAPVNVVATLLAAHAVPPEYAGLADDYVDLICREIIPLAAQEELADAVDVFCERIAFTPEQCRRIFETTRQYNLPVKGHTDQLSNFGGTPLAAEYGALSVDHLEHLDESGVAALAMSGTVAVLLPTACYYLRDTHRPPVEKLRAAGVPMAVSSDLNPGTSPLASIRLAMNMACTLFGLTPEEAVAGATIQAAKAVGLSEKVGSLTVGKQADFLVWNIESPAELAVEFGTPRLCQKVFKGIIVP